MTLIPLHLSSKRKTKTDYHKHSDLSFIADNYKYKIREFHIGISTLKKENETPQSMRIDISGQRLNSEEYIAGSQTTADTDLESQTDLKLMQKGSSKGIDAFPKENINIEAELQDEIRKGQKLQREIEDLQKKLVSLEEENKL